MSIRTTISLEEDLVERLKYESRRKGQAFKQTINDLLRLALDHTGDLQTRTLKIEPRVMGYKPGLNYDKVESLLEFGEGEYHR